MSPKKVLIVEDNWANRDLAAILLREAGHAVLIAADATEGIALARAEGPDLILMDISLPGIDGLAATGILKGDPMTRHIPVVAMTAHAMRDDRERMLAVGCDGYIAKPININAFRREIAARLESDREETNSR